MNRKDEDRAAEVRGALVKALAVVVVIGVVIAIGTTLVVRTLGLDDGGAAPTGAQSEPSEPLPTKALPVPGDDEEADEKKRDLVAPKKENEKKERLRLEVSPARAQAMERVNLTGAYRQEDNVELQVQRFENGAWSDFGVSATVRQGTYATYVMTGRTGPNRFRMFDPSAKLASNEVRVTIG